jgi:NAD(P)-dependent dehydrogenase (short-subunit alcohol dehydrogenase family)
MTAKSPVILILGAGANVGQAVARTFASQGYKVALAARSLNEADSTDNQLNIPSDFSKTDDIVNAFAKVKKVFGIPSVVIYNGKPSSTTVPLPVD